MASGIDPKFLNVDFNQNIEKTGLYTKRNHTKRLLANNVLLSTKQGQYIFEVGAECL